MMLNWSIYQEWLPWMQDAHIPAVMQTGCFEKYQFVRLLDVDEESGPTYAIQYYALGRPDYEAYINTHEISIKKEQEVKWGDNLVSFGSLMKIVS